jgi:hypothetical protein
MTTPFLTKLDQHINFSYSSFDRLLFRGYLPNMFVEGSVIRLLRNLGFTTHSNGVLKSLTDQLNSHICKAADQMGVSIHWWGSAEKAKYHSKQDFVKDLYGVELKSKRKTDKVICIIKATESTRTFANKTIKTKTGTDHTQMYSCSKFVSHYYIYIHDHKLGLCYLKIGSYLPFVCEFYMNGHNYLKQQFDMLDLDYRMKDNSFVQVSDTVVLKKHVESFQPSTALNRISYWMDVFFRFDKGARSTRSKLLTHQWFTYQAEISSNIIFKTEKFAESFFQRVLQKHHTIGVPDRLTSIFGLSKPVHTSKSTQNTYAVQACIKHWLEKNSIKCYNKSGCLLRVETTINNSELPGLKLKKQACHLQAYYWYGLGCNSRYLNTLADIDINSLTSELYEKYQKPIVNAKGVRVAAPDLRKDGQLELFCLLMSDKCLVYGFNNKQLRLKLKDEPKTARIAYELRKLRERGAIIKLKGSHYYRLTQEGYVWLYYSLFNYGHFVNPLLSMRNKKAVKSICENPSEVEKAYSMIDKAILLVTRELKLVA